MCVINIFYVDRNPGEAARSLGDAHILKMILESAQLLDTALSKSVVSRPVSVFNHPCANWVRHSRVSYEWLYNHWLELMNEYTKRFGKAHAYEKFAMALHPDNTKLPTVKWIDPPKIMLPVYHFNSGADTVAAYRMYYKHAKTHLHRYTKRQPPEWLSHGKV